jgi:glycosyltransferase involved in cell wall biosynthesis
MAFIPFFAIGPTSILSFIGFLLGPDKTVPNPIENWQEATVDLLIPSYNEEKTIVLCLSSISKQTLKPRQIILIDDASTDRTIDFAIIYAQELGLNLKIIKHDHNEGKTPSVYQAACDSDADVLALVDGDTVLKSDNYLERLIMELYQGVGIASACGMVLPLSENERKREYVAGNLQEFSQRHPHVGFSPDSTWFHLAQRAITNAYREELYLFLQNYIYKNEMVFFGTLIFPLGCAVVYRRKYLKKIFDKYLPIFGFDLTTSEDIFFGFEFAAQGYRNIAVRDVTALTTEPRFFKVYKQIFKWSSSFFQSCFYFNNLSLTPFKSFRSLKKYLRDRRDGKQQQIMEKRKIKEAYRQAFGAEYTTKYGRNIGWFVFTTVLEKIAFPTFLIVIILLRQWEILLITFSAEVLFYAVVIASISKKNRVNKFFKAIAFSPIRYSIIIFDLVVIVNFMLELWITKNRSWRK